MKFAIGFVVGAAIGRPVLKAVARKTRLGEKIRVKVASVAYNTTFRMLEKSESILFEGEPPNPRYQRRYRKATEQ